LLRFLLRMFLWTLPLIRVLRVLWTSLLKLRRCTRFWLHSMWTRLWVRIMSIRKCWRHVRSSWHFLLSFSLIGRRSLVLFRASDWCLLWFHYLSRNQEMTHAITAL
jgi:hypothetical protein